MSLIPVGLLQSPANATCTNDYNAYITSTNRLNPNGANDYVLSTPLVYQTGPLGTFYQTNTSPLLDVGSTTADFAGLFHYTTQISEYTEDYSQVDIGYHYVAVDGNGNPIDSDYDGIPDYLEDANGNGLIDSGETNWQYNHDLGLKVWFTHPRNGATPPLKTQTFTTYGKSNCFAFQSDVTEEQPRRLICGIDVWKPGAACDSE